MPTIVKNNTSIKVACFECIRGHRSSSCTHTNKVLIEVRKPGRPLNNTTSLASPSGVVPSNLQPAYVVFGHSQRQCPGDGVIPQDDWIETEAKPYPKSAALKTESPAAKGSKNRVTKTEPKARSRKSTLSKAVAKHIQDNGLELVGSPATSDGNDSINGGHMPVSPNLGLSLSPKANCCGGGAQVRGQDADSTGPISPTGNLLNELTATVYHLPGLGSDSPKTYAIQRGVGRKVIYDKKYNALDDDEFITFLRGLQPTDLRSKFPYDESIPQIPPNDHAERENDEDTAGAKCCSSTANQTETDMDDGCCCGDGCLCLGCSTHPANATTLKHVEAATKFMLEDPEYQQDDHVEADYIEAILNARRLSFTSQEQVPAAPQPSSHQPRASRSQFVPPAAPGPSPSWPSVPHFSSWNAPQFSGQTAILLTGYGTAQQIIPLQTYGGTGQVFVLAPPPPPKCFDQNGVCHCGPECQCEGCVTHKNTPFRPEITHPGGHNVYAAPTGLGLQGAGFHHSNHLRRPEADNTSGASHAGSEVSSSRNGREQRQNSAHGSRQNSLNNAMAAQHRLPSLDDFEHFLGGNPTFMDQDYLKHTIESSHQQAPIFAQSPTYNLSSPHAWGSHSFPTTQP